MLGNEAFVELHDFSGRLAAFCAIERVYIHKHDIVNVARNAVAKNLVAPADQPVLVNILDFQRIRFLAQPRGRSCSSANSLGCPGGTDMVTANSISTGDPIPQLPISINSSRCAGAEIFCSGVSGRNSRCECPDREVPSYKRVVFRRVCGGQAMTGCRPLRHPQGRNS